MAAAAVQCWISSPPTPNPTPPHYNLSSRWICYPPNPNPSCRYNLSSQRRRFVGVQCSLKSPSPWLVVPGGETGYNMYSLEEDRVVSLNMGKLVQDDNDYHSTQALVMGSSHGWLALYDTKSKRAFLSNPITGRHIKLPPLPLSRHLFRVILSCSPDDAAECCYAIQQNVASLAFCAVGPTPTPTPSDDWTLLVPESYEPDVFFSYWDFHYCSSRRVLSAISRSIYEFDSDGIRVSAKLHRHPNHQIDDWDIISNTKVDTTWYWKFRGPPHSWKENEDADFLINYCYQNTHLVHHQHQQQPLIVVRFVMNPMTRSEVPQSRFPFRTAGFLVIQMDKEGECIKVVDDLNGLAIFVGMNSSFAIPATGGKLKPNSIYFAPSNRTVSMYHYSYNDTGIFDYQNKTFSPCCTYSKDYIGVPMWFLMHGNPSSLWASKLEDVPHQFNCNSVDNYSLGVIDPPPWKVTKTHLASSQT